jgi:hypothetical protein
VIVGDQIAKLISFALHGLAKYENKEVTPSQVPRSVTVCRWRDRIDLRLLRFYLRKWSLRDVELVIILHPPKSKILWFARSIDGVQGRELSDVHDGRLIGTLFQSASEILSTCVG